LTLNPDLILELGRKTHGADAWEAAARDTEINGVLAMAHEHISGRLDMPEYRKAESWEWLNQNWNRDVKPGIYYAVKALNIVGFMHLETHEYDGNQFSRYGGRKGFGTVKERPDGTAKVLALDFNVSGKEFPNKDAAVLFLQSLLTDSNVYQSAGQ
jgi:hypothetical protein